MSLIMPEESSTGYNDSSRRMDSLNVGGGNPGQITGAGGSTGRELVEEASEVENTVYPTRMTGISASIERSGQELGVLKKLNSYDELLNNLSAEYNLAMQKIQDSESLKASWDTYQNSAIEIHKVYLRDERGKGTAKLFGQSFAEHLSLQRNRFERMMGFVLAREEKNEVRKMTDNALRKLLDVGDNEEKQNKYIDDAFNQSCEEAYLLGIGDDEAITGYAKKRILPAVEGVIQGYVDSGRYDEGMMYLGKLSDKIDEDNIQQIGRDIYVQEAINKIRGLSEQGKIDEVFEEMSILPGRTQRLAELAIRQFDKVRQKSEETLKKKALSIAQEGFNNGGLIRPYVMVEGKKVELGVEDYSLIFDNGNA